VPWTRHTDSGNRGINRNCSSAIHRKLRHHLRTTLQLSSLHLLPR
jgi:hypothetical protein